MQATSIACAPILGVERFQHEGKAMVKLSIRGAGITLPERAYGQYKVVREELARKEGDGKEFSATSASLRQRFLESGLLKNIEGKAARIAGASFYSDVFEPSLPFWLDGAFAHPFWGRMMEGRGSSRLYLGWLIELYHYTKNANRHMPLAVAFCDSKPIKSMLAKHYQEEWNHYHFFARAAAAIGIDKRELAETTPLPMTLEMSNFMRQAARDDILAYSICSAVLEGTTVDAAAYNPFYEAVKRHYDVPEGAVRPIYEHLELDQKYDHANLFQEICESAGDIDVARASKVLNYGHQMVEHIWLWTENIERYYGNEAKSLLRRPFDPIQD